MEEEGERLRTRREKSFHPLLLNVHGEGGRREEGRWVREECGGRRVEGGMESVELEKSMAEEVEKREEGEGKWEAEREGRWEGSGVEEGREKGARREAGRQAGSQEARRGGMKI